MSCKEIIEGASRQQKTLNAPMKINPRCHPRHHVDIHVDGLKGVIYLSCSKCDRLVTKIKVKGTNGTIVKSHR